MVTRDFTHTSGRVIDNLVTVLSFKPDLTGLEKTKHALLDMNDVLGGFGKRLAGIGAGMTLANIGHIAQFAGYEKSLKRMQALAGVAAEDLHKVDRAITDIALTFGKSQGDISEGIYFLASSSLSLEQAIDGARMAAKGAAVGLGEVGNLSQLILVATQAFRKDGLTATQVIDQLTKAVEVSALEADDLGGALSGVISMGSEMGVKFEEVVGLLAAMSQTGTSASEGVTQLNMVLTSLLDEGSDAAPLLASVGMSAQQLRDSIHKSGLFATLNNLFDSLGGVEATLVKRLFPEIRASRGVLNIFGNQVESSARALDAIADSAGATDEAWNVMRTAISSKWSLLWTAFVSTSTGIGKALGPATKLMLDVITPAFRAFARVLNTTNPLVRTFYNLMGGIGFAALTGGTLMIMAAWASKFMLYMHLFRGTIGVLRRMSGTSPQLGELFAQSRAAQAAQAAASRAGMGPLPLSALAFEGAWVWGMVNRKRKGEPTLGPEAKERTKRFFDMTDAKHEEAFQQESKRLRDEVSAQTETAKAAEREYRKHSLDADSADPIRAGQSKRRMDAARDAAQQAQRQLDDLATASAMAYTMRGEHRRQQRGSARFRAAARAWESVMDGGGRRVRRAQDPTALFGLRGAGRPIDTVARSLAELGILTPWLVLMMGKLTLRFHRFADALNAFWLVQRLTSLVTSMGVALWQGLPVLRRMALLSWAPVVPFTSFGAELGRESWLQARRGWGAGADWLLGPYAQNRDARGRFAAGRSRQWRTRPLGRAWGRVAGAGQGAGVGLVDMLFGQRLPQRGARGRFQQRRRQGRGAMSWLWNAAEFTDRIPGTRRWRRAAPQRARRRAVRSRFLERNIFGRMPGGRSLFRFGGRVAGRIGARVGLMALGGIVGGGLAATLGAVASIAAIAVLVYKNFFKIRELIDRLPSSLVWVKVILLGIAQVFRLLGFLVVKLAQALWWVVKQVLAPIIAAVRWIWNITRGIREWAQGLGHKLFGSMMEADADHPDARGGVSGRNTQLAPQGGATARGVPMYASGGIVPGRSWQMQPAMLHGGEAVLPSALTRRLMNASAPSNGGMVFNLRFDEGAVVVHDAQDARVVARGVVSNIEHEIRNLGYAFENSIDT